IGTLTRSVRYRSGRLPSPTSTASTKLASRVHWTRRFSSAAGSPSADTERSTRFRSTSSRSEEHTSELQSRGELVCRLLLEKKHRGRELQLNLVADSVVPSIASLTP